MKDQRRLMGPTRPRMKGHIERLFGTFQDRLVVELRLANADDAGGGQCGAGRVSAAVLYLVAVDPLLVRTYAYLQEPLFVVASPSSSSISPLVT